LTTFSPSGKLLQIEYALNAVAQGKSTIGIKATNGVVIATEKKWSSPLIDEESVEKIVNVADHIGIGYAGMAPDFRLIVRKARKKAQLYYRVYHEPQPTSQLVRDVAAVMQEFTQSGGVRPFGVSLLAAGYDDEGPQLYQIDPSGASFGWKASAIGKNYISAKSFLEKRYHDEMELEDAIHTALITLKESFEGEMTEENIEVGVITTDRKFRVLSAAEVRDYLLEME
jgi:20S proteasome subunit alpha 2